MKQLLFLALLPLLLIPVYAQEEVSIPSWIKVVAGAWANNELTDLEYSQAMSFLIEQEIIKINQDVSKSQVEDFTNQIQSLESEIIEIGLDNSQLLLGVVEKQKQIDLITDQFNDYKSSHSHKVGNIGGAPIDANTINQLQEQIQNLESVISELENEIRRTKQ